MLNLAALWFSVLANEEDDLVRRIREAARDRPSWRAELRIERSGRRVETASTERGRLVVRAGAAEFRGRPVEKEAGVFHPLDLWTGADPAERFRVTLVRRPGEGRLPEAVVTSAGTPVRAVRTRLGRSVLAAPEAEDAAERVHVLALVPREAALRERISSIRLFVEAETGRIRRAVIDTPSMVETYSIENWEES